LTVLRYVILHKLKHNKTIELLKYLEISEIETFDQFLNSKFFSRKKKAALLFRFLKKFAPKYDSEKLNEISCYNYVFKNEPCNNIVEIKKKLKNPFYDLKQLFTRFILTQEIEKNTYEKELLLLKAMKNRKIKPLYTASTEALLTKVQADESENLFQQYLMFGLQDELYTNEDYKQSISDKKESELLTNLLSSLDEFYLENKYRYSLQANIREQLTGQSVNNQLISVLDNANAKEIIKNNPSIDLYKKLRQYHQSKEPAIEIIQLKFLQDFDKLSMLSKQDIGISLLNSWMTLHREGRQDALQMLFDLYQNTIALNDQIWFENEHFDVTHFRNIVVVSCALQKYEWTNVFIENYGKLLPTKVKENVIGMSKAQVYKATGNCNKVIETLNQVEFSDWIDQLTAKSLMLQCFYELKEWNSLSYFIDSFEKYLRRNKSISADVKTGHLNYVSFCRRLLKMQGQSSEKISKLNSRLKATENISGRMWLAEKIKELLD